VAVESGQAYSFSIWRAQYDGDNSPNLGLAVVPCVDGLPVEDEKKIIKSGSGENTLMQWTQLAGDWVASSSVDSVFIRVELDISEVTGGGLIAIDDISFTNTCKNVSSQVANKFYLNKSEAELCSAGGEVPVNILNDNSTEYVYSSGNEVFWYEGKGEEQTLLDSINNKTNPVFKSPGHFRVCIKDPVNGCVINDDLIITQSLDLGTYDIELCNNNSELKTTSVKSGSKSCGVPTWAFPSGKKQTAYEIMADEVGSYSVIVGGINGYKCKSSASFNVTSQIPNAKKDTVLFCTSAPDNIYVESDNGEEFIWAYDSNMTQLIDTSSAFWLPEATEDTFNIYFKRLAQDELGVLNEDSTSFYNGGYSRFPAVDYYNILKDGVVLKELYLRTQFWESGCNATYGETGSSYIVINGPTYDSIPFDFVCGAYTKVDVNVELVPGNYEIRTGLYTVVGSIEEVGSIGGYVEQTGSDNGGVNKFYSKVKFTKANNCKAGKLLAVGEFCDFVNGSDERNQEDFSVFPNPASNAIYFNKMLDEVSLYTSNGQYISSYTNVRSISLDSLQSGVYFLRSNGLTKSIVKK